MARPKCVWSRVLEPPPLDKSSASHSTYWNKHCQGRLLWQQSWFIAAIQDVHQCPGQPVHRLPQTPRLATEQDTTNLAARRACPVKNTMIDLKCRSWLRSSTRGQPVTTHLPDVRIAPANRMWIQPNIHSLNNVSEFGAGRLRICSPFLGRLGDARVPCRSSFVLQMDKAELRFYLIRFVPLLCVS